MRPSALFAIAAILLASAPAAADVGPKITTGWYLPVGLTLGGSVHPDDMNGFVLGAEVSGVHFSARSMFWVGAYTDALYDFGPNAFRFSVGPEIGYSVLGLDFGYLGVADDHEGYSSGIQLRAIVSLGVLSAYGRWGHVFGDVGEHDFGELGVLIKVPFELDVEPYRFGPPVEPPVERPPPAGEQRRPAP